ncbi:MAG: phage terminase large subunit family protein [Rhizorhabdus sp.]
MHYEELYQSVKLRFGSTGSTASMGDWICENTTIKKRPFSFEDYSFQKAIADDMHPDLACKKCSQIGLTEVQLRKFLAILARSTAISGIFSLPNEKMFTKVYNGRLKPILETDTIFNPPTGVKPTRSKDQIQIRDSFGYITACTEGDATSINADFVFHDELDLSPQEIITLYQSRLQGSDMRITQAFSTPTFINYGIDAKYKLSDQREYLVKCAACNHYQIPRFSPSFVHLDVMPFEVENFMDLTPEQISLLDLNNCYVKCERCERRLDLATPSRREWVATFPSRTVYRGYQVRPFSTSRLKPGYIFTQLGKYLTDGFPRRFANTVLGEEYTAADAQIQKTDIETAMNKGTPNIPTIGKDIPVYLGVDVGFMCHITLSIDGEDGNPVFVLFETVAAAGLEERIRALSNLYTIVQGAVDRFPYTPQADALRDVTNGLIVPIQYRGTSMLQPVKEPDTGVLSHYSAGRTSILDRVLWLFSHKGITLSGYQGQKETLNIHLTDMVRDEQSPEKEAEWKKTTGNDHYLHSMALNLLARRVCEHMYANQTDTIATTPMLIGAGWGNTHNLGPSSMKGLNRFSRLG